MSSASKSIIISNLSKYIISPIANTIADYTHFSGTLCNKGYKIKKSFLTESELDNLKIELMLVPRQRSVALPTPVLHSRFDARVQPLNVYYENDTHIYVPKYFANKKYHYEHKMDLNTSLGKNINISSTIQLRNNQVSPFKLIENGLDTIGSKILCLPCGSGATYIAIDTIVKIKRKTLIIAPTIVIMNCWELKLKELTNAKVNIMKPRKIISEDLDIVLCTLHNIKNFDPQIFEDFGYIIIDNCHSVATKTYLNLLFNLSCKRVLGLLSHKLSEEQGKILHWHFG
jgi:hypothetical protein